ncbi:type II secretion system GspH family protein [Chitiniphilus purpureus]|uniref:Type II secretion system GspH family protein n=1 Tax=Chitiniphilus purpureus TaxID=2981137 RepID=A0ABY6DLY1_9NEIS|nr:type II secretion system GspH family protein [Chitiniphilus sp. CD1]UXY15213.1 type II secretion system GspH family protein [Chitiniphilus sp. CD1]
MKRLTRLRAFTLIELLVVLAIVAMLTTIALPRYFQSLDHAKEGVLKENLLVLRRSIDRFHADKGRYPNDLAELVSARYLHAVPVDPLTDSAETWVVAPPQDGEPGGVAQVHSGASGTAQDGTAFGAW